MAVALVGSGLTLSAAELPASAHHSSVIAVEGSAFGYHAYDVTLFGGPQPVIGPTPTVALSSNASNSPRSATAPSGIIQYGPATLFTSDQIDVATSGGLGVTGSVSSSTGIKNVNKAASHPGSTGSEILTADNVASTCTATLSSVTGSTTITNGTLQTDSGYDANGDGDYVDIGEHPPVVVALPNQPAANTEHAGHIHLSATSRDDFRVVFNEQVPGSRSLVVNAVHEYLGTTQGSVLKGHIVLGQSKCALITAAPNHAPVAADDSYSTLVGVPVHQPAPGVLANDTDLEGGSLTAGSASDPANGTVRLDPNGSFTYIPDPLFIGTDSFTYVATDPAGGTDTATVTIDVAAPNLPPEAEDDAYATNEDTPLDVAAPGVLSNDTDPNDDALSAQLATVPSSGTIVLNANGSFAYTPSANFAGVDSFTYTASDGNGGTDTATVTISVAGINDASIDFNADGATDISVFRAASGSWFSSSGTAANWGAQGDVAVPADYDGVAGSEIAVFRPSSGTWFVRGGPATAWGTQGDLPVPADYDGDNKADVAVFRPSTGAWYIDPSGGGPNRSVGWGTQGDIPVPGDYNDDGTDEIAVFRPSTGTWFVAGGPTLAWGTSGDIPVPADYDGDGATDMAVFRPSTGTWFVEGGPSVGWGTQGDIPVPGDFAGDGSADIAVFRPSTGTWFVFGGATTGWGTSGDQALPLPPAIRMSST